jgi:hypothetical protein
MPLPKGPPMPAFVLAMMAAGLFAVLGALHLAYTVHDFTRRPRYFRPLDISLLAAMRQTRAAIAPTGRDYWSGIMGFHFSHSIGVLLLALLIVIATLYRIAWLKPLLVIVGALFGVIAWRCWFRIPMLGCLAATALAAAAWIL